MGRVKEFVGDVGGALTAGGTANALTVTANSAFAAYADGQTILLRIATDNTAAATLNVNSIGAKAIRKMDSTGDVGLGVGDLQATGIYQLCYSAAINSAAGGWLLLNPTENTWERIKGLTTFIGVASISVTDLSAYRVLRASGGIIPSAAGSNQMLLRLSTDNGSSYIAGTSYLSQAHYVYGASPPTHFASGYLSIDGIPLASGEYWGVNTVGSFEFQIHNFNQATTPMICLRTNYAGNASGYPNIAQTNGWLGSGTPRDAWEIILTAGAPTMAGYYTLEGIRG